MIIDVDVDIVGAVVIDVYVYAVGVGGVWGREEVLLGQVEEWLKGHHVMGLV